MIPQKIENRRVTKTTAEIPEKIKKISVKYSKKIKKLQVNFVIKNS